MFNKHQGPEERLSAWRNVRQGSYDTVEQVLEEFASIKIVPRYIDYFTPRDWPNVFDIVKEGYFCQSGITLIMTATLVHKGFISTEDLTFAVISNHINGNDGLVLIHQNSAYNFLPGKIITLEEVKENSTQFGSHTIAVNQLFC
jgi:hypothetical protein